MRHKFLFLFFISLMPMKLIGATEDANQAYFQGDTERAIQLDRTAWIQDRNTDAALDVASMAAELGKPDEPIKTLQEAYDLFPSSASLWRELLWARSNREEWSRVRTLLDAKPQDPNEDPRVAIARARLAMADKDFDKGKDVLESLVRRQPKLTLAHYYLAKLAEEAQRPNEAIASYQQLLKEDSQFIEVRPALARLFEQQKKADDAWRQYSRITIADSENIEARRGLRRLSKLVTQSPAQLAPPKKIPSHAMALPKGPPSNIIIKVGVGTNSAGKPSRRKMIFFRCSAPFAVIDPDTGKELKIGASNTTWRVNLDSKLVATITDANGKTLGRFQHSVIIHSKSTTTATIILNSLEFAQNTSWGGLADKELRGDLEIRVGQKSKTLIMVNRVSLEEYVYGVLAAEMPVHWPLEALKAQAVIARSQALYRRGFHKRFGYDVCDEEHCQVYTGVAVESEKVRKATDETAGKYVAYRGSVANTVFSSNCGGLTQTGRDAGWPTVPYWTSVSDAKPGAEKPTSASTLRWFVSDLSPAFCESSNYTWHPEYRSTRIFDARDLEAKLAHKKNIGKIKSLQITKRNHSGRVQSVRVVGTKGVLVLSKENQIRHYLGLGALRSTYFVVDTIYKDGQPDKFVFFVAGWGHAVGLCQSGAAGRAESGQTYQEILAAYFQNTTLQGVRSKEH